MVVLAELSQLVQDLQPVAMEQVAVGELVIVLLQMVGQEALVW